VLGSVTREVWTVGGAHGAPQIQTRSPDFSSVRRPRFCVARCICDHRGRHVAPPSPQRLYAANHQSPLGPSSPA